MESLIHFKDADILNGETVVLYNLNMDIMPGDFVYIVGKVGSGKTSIIRTITAENKLLKGEGEACGYNLRTLKKRDIPYLRRSLGVIFQDFQLLTDRRTNASGKCWKPWAWAPRPTRCRTSSPAASSSALPLPGRS